MADMLIQPDIAEAIRELDNSNFIITGSDPTTEAEYKKNVVFYTDSTAKTVKEAPVTWSQVQTKYNAMMVLYNNNSYARKRIVDYAPVKEQLDKLFHDIDQGKLDKTGSFYTHIKKVKDDAPKE